MASTDPTNQNPSYSKYVLPGALIVVGLILSSTFFGVIPGLICIVLGLIFLAKA